MNDYTHADSEIVRCPAGEGDIGKRAGNAFGLTVTGKHRVVVEFEDANIKSLAGADVEPTTQLHRETRLPVFDPEIELRKKIQNLLLFVCVTRETGERVGKWLDASIAAVVLQLYTRKKIVEVLLVINSLRYAWWRELVHK